MTSVLSSEFWPEEEQQYLFSEPIWKICTRCSSPNIQAADSCMVCEFSLSSEIESSWSDEDPIIHTIGAEQGTQGIFRMETLAVRFKLRHAWSRFSSFTLRIYNVRKLQGAHRIIAAVTSRCMMSRNKAFLIWRKHTLSILDKDQTRFVLRCCFTKLVRFSLLVKSRIKAAGNTWSRLQMKPAFEKWKVRVRNLSLMFRCFITIHQRPRSSMMLTRGFRVLRDHSIRKIALKTSLLLCDIAKRIAIHGKELQRIAFRKWYSKVSMVRLMKSILTRFRTTTCKIALLNWRSISRRTSSMVKGFHVLAHWQKRNFHKRIISCKFRVWKTATTVHCDIERVLSQVLLRRYSSCLQYHWNTWRRYNLNLRIRSVCCNVARFIYSVRTKSAFLSWRSVVFQRINRDVEKREQWTMVVRPAFQNWYKSVDFSKNLLLARAYSLSKLIYFFKRNQWTECFVQASFYRWHIYAQKATKMMKSLDTLALIIPRSIQLKIYFSRLVQFTKKARIAERCLKRLFMVKRKSKLACAMSKWKSHLIIHIGFVKCVERIIATSRLNMMKVLWTWKVTVHRGRFQTASGNILMKALLSCKFRTRIYFQTWKTRNTRYGVISSWLNTYTNGQLSHSYTRWRDYVVSSKCLSRVISIWESVSIRTAFESLVSATIMRKQWQKVLHTWGKNSRSIQLHFGFQQLCRNLILGVNAEKQIKLQIVTVWRENTKQKSIVLAAERKVLCRLEQKHILARICKSWSDMIKNAKRDSLLRCLISWKVLSKSCIIHRLVIMRKTLVCCSKASLMINRLHRFSSVGESFRGWLQLTELKKLSKHNALKYMFRSQSQKIVTKVFHRWNSFYKSCKIRRRVVASCLKRRVFRLQRKGFLAFFNHCQGKFISNLQARSFEEALHEKIARMHSKVLVRRSQVKVLRVWRNKCAEKKTNDRLIQTMGESRHLNILLERSSMSLTKTTSALDQILRRQSIARCRRYVFWHWTKYTRISKSIRKMRDSYLRQLFATWIRFWKISHSLGRLLKKEIYRQGFYKIQAASRLKMAVRIFNDGCIKIKARRSLKTWYWVSSRYSVLEMAFKRGCQRLFFKRSRDRSQLHLHVLKLMNSSENYFMLRLHWNRWAQIFNQEKLVDALREYIIKRHAFGRMSKLVDTKRMLLNMKRKVTRITKLVHRGLLRFALKDWHRAMISLKHYQRMVVLRIPSRHERCMNRVWRAWRSGVSVNKVIRRLVSKTSRSRLLSAFGRWRNCILGDIMQAKILFASASAVSLFRDKMTKVFSHNSRRKKDSDLGRFFACWLLFRFRSHRKSSLLQLQKTHLSQIGLRIKYGSCLLNGAKPSMQSKRNAWKQLVIHSLSKNLKISKRKENSWILCKHFFIWHRRILVRKSVLEMKRFTFQILKSGFERRRETIRNAELFCRMVANKRILSFYFHRWTNRYLGKLRYMKTLTMNIRKYHLLQYFSKWKSKVLQLRKFRFTTRWKLRLTRNMFSAWKLKVMQRSSGRMGYTMCRIREIFYGYLASTLRQSWDLLRRHTLRIHLIEHSFGALFRRHSTQQIRFAFHVWRKFSVDFSLCLNALSRLGKRYVQIRLHSGFDRFRDATKRKLDIQTKMHRVVKLSICSRVFAAIRRWELYHLSSCRSNSVVQNMVIHIQMYSCRSYWNKWQDFIQQKRLKEHLALKICRQWNYRRVAVSFHKWIEIEGQHRILTKLGRIWGYFQKKTVIQAVHQWKKFSFSMSIFRHKLCFVLFRIQNRNRHLMDLAYKSWRLFCHKINAREKNLSRALSNVFNKVLFRQANTSFSIWKNSARDQQNVRTRIQNILRRWQYRLKLQGFGALKSHLWLHRVLLRCLSSSSKTFLKTAWKKWSGKIAHQVTVIKKFRVLVLRKWKQNLSLAFTRWDFVCNATSQVLLHMQHVASLKWKLVSALTRERSTQVKMAWQRVDGMRAMHIKSHVMMILKKMSFFNCMGYKRWFYRWKATVSQKQLRERRLVSVIKKTYIHKLRAGFTKIFRYGLMRRFVLIVLGRTVNVVVKFHRNAILEQGFFIWKTMLRKYLKLADLSDSCYLRVLRGNFSTWKLFVLQSDDSWWQSFQQWKVFTRKRVQMKSLLKRWLNQSNREMTRAAFTNWKFKMIQLSMLSKLRSNALNVRESVGKLRNQLHGMRILERFLNPRSKLLQVARSFYSWKFGKSRKNPATSIYLLLSRWFQIQEINRLCVSKAMSQFKIHTRTLQIHEDSVRILDRHNEFASNSLVRMTFLMWRIYARKERAVAINKAKIDEYEGRMIENTKIIAEYRKHVLHRLVNGNYSMGYHFERWRRVALCENLVRIQNRQEESIKGIRKVRDFVQMQLLERKVTKSNLKK